MGNLNRRTFIGRCTAAAGLLGTGDRMAFAADTPQETRIGVLSDIHIIDPASAETFEKALRWFDQQKVDGVLICGDLADWGLEPQLKVVADTWFRVFPNDRRSDGQPITKLFHYGDHDMGGYAHLPNVNGKRQMTPGMMTRLTRLYGFADEAAVRKSVIPFNDPGAIWERCFHEPWSPIQIKTVKGYTFVLGHHSNAPDSQGGNVVPGVEEALRRLNPDPVRPFFYSQHRILRNTAGGPYAWGQERGVVTKILEKYPNCIAFCGHGHIQATDERNIWQGAFTAIEVPSLSYLLQHPGRENGFNLFDNPKATYQMPRTQTQDGRQGYLMHIYADRIVLDRHDFVYGDVLGASWTIPLPSPGAGHLSHAWRAEHDAAPEFPQGAKVSVKAVDGRDRAQKPTRQLVVTFPVANPTATTPRAYDYEVRAIVRKGDVTRTAIAKRVYSPKIYLASSRDKGPCTCVFAEDELPANRDALTFEVRPFNAFGRSGTAIRGER